MDDAGITAILETVREIRDLIRLVAEPAIAERDKKLRGELRQIVGKSPRKASAALLMDGTRTQAAIIQDAKINQGDLSTLVKRLDKAKLLSGDRKKPKLAIVFPANLFANEKADE